jgi:hypothetical protein
MKWSSGELITPFDRLLIFFLCASMLNNHRSNPICGDCEIFSLVVAVNFTY